MTKIVNAVINDSEPDLLNSLPIP